MVTLEFVRMGQMVGKRKLIISARLITPPRYKATPCFPEPVKSAHANTLHITCIKGIIMEA